MPGFPSPFTVDADIPAYSAEQNIANFLESGNNYTALHLSAREEVMKEIRNNGADPDLVETPSLFKKAAIYFLLSDIFASERDMEKSKEYGIKFGLAVKRAMGIAIEEEGGGQVGRVTAECHGAITATGFGKPQHYRRRRADRRFG